MVKMLTFLACLLFLKFSTACPIFDGKTCLKYRLPTGITPINYDITLQPDLRPNLDPAPFNGSLKVRITPTEDTDTITLQIRKLTIDDSSVDIKDLEGNILDIDNITTDSGNEFYIITTKQQLLVSKSYILTIGRYDGILHLDNGGFYLAKYVEDGVENDLGNGISKDVYRESVLMSTYLVAFVVSQYEYIQKENQRVFARPQAVRDGWCEYALMTGLKTIQVLENYLDVKYTLDKMDQIAIPDVHFSPGAMENWGLVTYRESYLLYSELYSTTGQLQKICTVVAHEFAHQWFGNLVTLQWWKYTWLNEGFATYFEQYAASLVEPTWRLMDQFAFVVHDALEYDSTNSTTPMNYESASGSGAPTLITYDKGASILRMAEHFLTEEVYKKSLNIYLNARQFSTSIPEDLYHAFQTAVDEMGTPELLGGYTVSNILAPWTDQEGYPVLTITRDYATGGISLEQKRFLLKNYTGQNTTLLWPVPVNFMFSARDAFDFSKTTADFWFTTRQENLSGGFPTDGFVIANKQQTGFYRVNYDLENWYRIIDHLTSESYQDIIPIHRAQLINDAFSFAKAGVINYDVPLDLSRYMAMETDYIPIKAFLTEVKFLENKVAFSSTLEYFKIYVLNQLSQVAEELTFYDRSTDDHLTKLNRVAVMTQICNLGGQECLAKSLESLREWRQNSSFYLSPDMQEYVFCSALRIGTEDDWNFMYQKYLIEDVEFLKLRILNALGCSENEDILVGYMNKIVEDHDSIRETDRQSAFATIYNSGNFGLTVAFEYLTNNFYEMKNSSVNINTIIKGFGTKFNTEEYRGKFLKLAETHGYEYFGAALRSVEENMEWNDMFLSSINHWFANPKAILSL